MRRLVALLAVFAFGVAASPSTMRVTATAYCQAGKTQSGTRARSGIVAADPAVLPVGTILRIIDGPTAGLYTVMDTGSAIKGRKIDIFIPNCERALKFGERSLRVRILRRGWNPKATPAGNLIASSDRARAGL
jgi:3D (Asp-Asp-Asp) domain-containing protein